MKSLMLTLADWFWSLIPTRRNNNITDLYRRLRVLTRRVEDVETWVNEQRVRELTRKMFDTPEGQAWLNQWFGDQR